MIDRFAAPKSDTEVVEARKKAIPKKTQQDTDYCIRQWEAWRKHRNEQDSSIPMAYWMERFILEVRKLNGSEYQPNTLYHIVCGIMRYIRITFKADIDFFKDSEFAGFCGAEMKRLQSKGLGSDHKQAEAFTVEEEELLWEKEILGDQSPESLLNTII